MIGEYCNHHGLLFDDLMQKLSSKIGPSKIGNEKDKMCIKHGHFKCDTRIYWEQNVSEVMSSTNKIRVRVVM